MNETWNNIAALADEVSLQKNIDELTAIADRYPYFAFPQFLLAKKLKEQDYANATRQLQKCALYFSNPFWLHYLLSEDEAPINDPVGKKFYETTNSTVELSNAAEQPEEKLLQNKFSAEEPETDTSAITEYTEESTPESNIASETTEPVPQEILPERIESAAEKHPGETSIIAEQKKEITPETNFSAETAEPAPEETLSQKNEPAIEEYSTEVPITSEQTDETPDGSNISSETTIPITEEVIENRNINDEEQGMEASAEETNAEREKLSKLIERHLSEFKKPLESSEEIPISPRVYHAIDYFASQGIKLDPRLITEDVLESKVKKFTDWLKQIKRVNENPSDLGTDIETERLIEKIAQSSNETKDVITETMAEVLVKQGKLEKAIQLYQKLSFLDPSKTTYFAAKINELKGSK